MPMSEYVRSLRAHIGHGLLLLPAVTAVIRDGERILLARGPGVEEWTLIGGGVEPAEEPRDALMREVQEEIGARLVIGEVIGAYGGQNHVVTYPNGDRVSYMTVAFTGTLLDPPVPDQDEIIEARWFTRAEIAELPRAHWVDEILADLR